MNWWNILSQLVNENERDLRDRFRRARALATGNTSTDVLADGLTGRIFLVTTWTEGQGETDFKLILSRERYRVAETFRIEWWKYGGQSIPRALRKCRPVVTAGDIVAVVRGGGDTTDKQFEAFRSPEACEALNDLRQRYGVVVVTGIGHSNDHFPVDEVATFAQATPTDAAYKICELLKVGA